MTEITKVLVANRGEIACRIFRTLDRMGIPGVAIHHPADARSPALAMASEVVEVDGPTPVASYLDVQGIVDVCRRTGADAVHPGFGFLAENAGFARCLSEEGFTFIGPSPEAIELMGDKVVARSFCAAHGFPLAPSVDEAEADGDFAERLARIPPPILIKPAAGGGGKGMHIVRDMETLERVVELAKGEALRSFGDDSVYAERYVEQARHIEVQILADHHGEVIHLGERECSIQRRFQKIVEESPAPGLAPELRERICATAVDVARTAGYRNAGTVEFLLAPDGEFYFLEMNTRIQVEHPVTEMVTGLDLVEWQVRIARGEALPWVQQQIEARGHAIEMRLYAEDPENGFVPATGDLLVYELPRGEGIRVDDGFSEGMAVSSAFDPMLAKLIVHGEDRDQALERAAKALEETTVLGVTTNVDYLGRIVSHPDFAAGQVHTGFISLSEVELRPPPLSAGQRDLLLAAAALGSHEFTDPEFGIPEPYSSIGGWRN
jgi:propionyl-CoA carboxylase alpha chain/3-methylcrotonyl-CoA carboxylase alpha subunit/acetyl-CoA/propionyl-CoA carboxylase biotin carboxyl carrier protein